MTTPDPNTSREAPAFALLHPDGRLEWEPLSAQTQVRTLIAQKYGDRSIASTWLGPHAPASPTSMMRILASDVASVFPEEFPANLEAYRVLFDISGGVVYQQWRGLVVLCEYDRDPDTGEVGFPQEMSPEGVALIAGFFPGT